jgi:hypothetical protein
MAVVVSRTVCGDIEYEELALVWLFFFTWLAPVAGCCDDGGGAAVATAVGMGSNCMGGGMCAVAWSVDIMDASSPVGFAPTTIAALSNICAAPLGGGGAYVTGDVGSDNGCCYCDLARLDPDAFLFRAVTAAVELPPATAMDDGDGKEGRGNGGAADCRPSRLARASRQRFAMRPMGVPAPRAAIIPSNTLLACARSSSALLYAPGPPRNSASNICDPGTRVIDAQSASFKSFSRAISS